MIRLAVQGRAFCFFEVFSRVSEIITKFAVNF